MTLVVFLGASNLTELGQRGVLDAYMWRSNVLRLRNCSSAPIRRYGVNINTRRYSSEKSLPVTKEEFERAFSKVLKAKWDTESNTSLGTRS